MLTWQSQQYVHLNTQNGNTLFRLDQYISSQYIWPIQIHIPIYRYQQLGYRYPTLHSMNTCNRTPHSAESERLSLRHISWEFNLAGTFWQKSRYILSRNCDWKQVWQWEVKICLESYFYSYCSCQKNQNSSQFTFDLSLRDQRKRIFRNHNK